jgi:uroporphyrin-3 C-methyltransferase
MRLLAIDGQVDKLPMMVRQSESNADAMPADKSLPWWRRGLSESWAALQKIIVVRYHASGVPPLIAPGQEEFLLQNLHATLERAMWAVLNKKQDVYQTSVQKASDWVSTYFIVNLPATQGILTTFSQLKQMDIHPAIPEITASLQAFHHDD